MVTEIFSNSLPEYTGRIENPALQDSLSILKEIAGKDYRVLEWSDQYIAVPLQIRVDLPTLGNYKNIDIRPIEPILIVFDKTGYPYTAPRVFTNRTDFPKNKLAHLYIAKHGRPPAFCYVRGNTDEWYANKRMQDLLIRISNWLRDAATGELTEDGNQFEPLRLEGYSGTVIYDYDQFAEIVHTNNSLLTNTNWTIGLFERAKDDEGFSFKLLKILTTQNFIEVFEGIGKEENKDKEAVDEKHYHLGYLLWSNQEVTFPEYEVDLPQNWEMFKGFCELYNIDTTSFEETISEANGNSPVILAIKRPTNIIGFSSNIEFINLYCEIRNSEFVEGKIPNDLPIKIQSHNQPLTQSKAQIISGTTGSFSEKTVVFGCGALGSKIIMHFGRSGQTAFTLIDPDHMSPHNLVRHALTSGDLGSNKAFALAETIKKIYPYEEIKTLNSGVQFKEGLFDQPETFKKYKWILDFTASESFFNKLVLAKNMDASQICSASLSDFGNLGIMLKEGENRNPRIDDLQAILYSSYNPDQNIREWLAREQKAATTGNLTVNVGVGCDSETTVLSDDKVSSHSAYFAGAIKHEMKTYQEKPEGKIFLNRIIETEDYRIETTTISVQPFDVLTAVNDSTWSIRFKNGILNEIQIQARKANRKETGGVFIGIANYKTKTIHVTDLILAPPDSQANSVCFYRGHQGLPEQIEDITKGSGGQLGYIGEWHSHPLGPNELSATDMESVNRFKAEFAKLTTPLPVFLTIIAPKGVLPFVF